MIPALTAAVAIWLAWLIGREVRERHDAKTVEQEQAESREVIACIGQHHPSIADEYCADDSISTFVAGMELDRRVNGL